MQNKIQHSRYILYINRIFTFVMVVVFLVQPIHNVYADEIEVLETGEDRGQLFDGVVEDLSSESTGELELNASEEEVEGDGFANEISLEEVDKVEDEYTEEQLEKNESLDGGSGEDLLEISTSTANSTDLNSGDNEVLATSSLESTLSTTTDTGGNEIEATEPNSDQNESSFTEVVSVNNKNKYQFSASECSVVESGSFFCVKAESVKTDVSQTSVYTDVGPAGFTDIFIKDTSRTSNITSSSYNNSSPFYDSKSNTVVFQTEYQGRHIIESYDVRKKITTRITNGQYNDVLPKRNGDYIVWQRWLNNAWQIVLFDGMSERVITTSAHHNLSPSINEGMILWSTFNSAGEKIGAYYDIATERLVYIDSVVEGRIQNPRFVLVYETVSNNGDIITHGFDPETGLSKPIASLPAVPLPEIPSPDPVGEVRALTSKNDEDETGIEQVSSTDNIEGTDKVVEDVNSDIVLPKEESDTELNITEYDIYVPQYEVEND